jgi:MarR family transcriptional regulator, 2-MHQ and catechol-resistance regulon repressor
MLRTLNSRAQSSVIDPIDLKIRGRLGAPEATAMPTLPGMAREHSLAEPAAPLEDLPFADVTRALVKAGFLIINRAGAPHHKYRLSLAEADVLVAVARAREGRLNCSEIAEKTLITKGGITKVLDRLETRGLIKRVPSREDRRSISIQLSAKGVDFWRRFNPEVACSAREVLEKAFRPEQVKQFSTLLALLIRSLEVDSAKTSIRTSERPREKSGFKHPIRHRNNFSAVGPSS